MKTLREVARMLGKSSVRSIAKALALNPPISLRKILESNITPTLITYYIVKDVDGKLEKSAKVACNFWNKFISPKYSIVVRLGIFTEDSDTIARAYAPYEKDGVFYGVVEFNTKYLSSYTRNEISGTIAHEIGHTLGMGWSDWMGLFNSTTGVFTDAAINMLPDLSDMRVETHGGSGTRLSHWDEDRHGASLMTGWKNSKEHVLPVTIRIMGILGHRIAEDLPQKTDLDSLLNTLSQVMFSRQAEARALNLDYFEETEPWENIPHDQPLPQKMG
ncbi:M57 family metalloprotease [Alkalinema pantanalense CENA528]|uniref:M57 family metalloprotease n=1 Tax=Alkalinema pantanalense TaxID=1620705 RepID=UPI003D6FD39A